MIEPRLPIASACGIDDGHTDDAVRQCGGVFPLENALHVKCFFIE
jgi:hypothetical protein